MRTKAELFRALGVSHSNEWWRMRTEMRLPTLFALAEVLGVPAKVLLPQVALLMGYRPGEALRRLHSTRQEMAGRHPRRERRKATAPLCPACGENHIKRMKCDEIRSREAALKEIGRLAPRYRRHNRVAHHLPRRP